MSKIQFEKTILVKDSNGVTRQAFLGGESIDTYIFKDVLKNDEIVNPDDLPDEAKSLYDEKNSDGKKMETKVLPLKDESADSNGNADIRGEEDTNIKLTDTEEKPKAPHKHKTTKGK